VYGVVNGFPLYEQLFERGGADRREAVEALVALVLFAPFAEKEALGFESTEERIQGALLDVDAMVGERLAERVAVVLLMELSKDGQDKAAAAELEPEIFENGLGRFAHTVLHTLYDT
jgi:hypothetical protein